MPSDPKSDPASNPSSRNPLPFEPTKSRKQSEKKSEKKSPAALATDKSDERVNRSQAKESAAIPEVVSRRMVRRMALFCGVPTLLGASSFFVSYFLVTKDIAHLPNTAVVLISMGFFGMGVLGLTYGVLSASWDEESTGSRLGWTEFTTNLGRMTAAWRDSKKS